MDEKTPETDSPFPLKQAEALVIGFGSHATTIVQAVRVEAPPESGNYVPALLIKAGPEDERCIILILSDAAAIAQFGMAMLRVSKMVLEAGPQPPKH